MRDSVWAHPTARKLLTGDGFNEVVIMWNDPSTGLHCKARLDRLTSYNGRTIIADLKSTKDASEWAMGYDCFKYGYNIQFAFYRRGLHTLDSSRSRQCWIVAPENIPPHCTAVYRVDDDAIDAAEATVQNLMFKYAECEKKGFWPGYSSDVEKLYLPPYAYKEESADNEMESIVPE
jgi:hypothetical protein